MTQFFANLAAESSINAKQDLIRAATLQEKEVLRMALDPFTPTYLKKFPIPKTHGNKGFWDNYTDFYSLFERLTNRWITGNTARAAVHEFLESCTPEAQEIFASIIRKKLNAGVGAKLVNKAMGYEFVPVFDVQLAYPYSEDKKYGVDYWYASRKLNGLRGYWQFQDKKCPCDPPIRSREGHPFLGFDHIKAELQDLRQRYNLDFVDGELYNHQLPFQTIQSYVRGDKNIPNQHKRKIFFNIFAVGSIDALSTEQMVALLKKINWKRYTYLKPVEYFKIPNNPQVILEEMMRLYKEGYEGLMLRSPLVQYVWKRSNDLLKYKPFKEGDFTIIDVQLGEPDGRFAHTMGTIVISGEVKVKVNGKKEVRKVCCEVGSGFSEFSLDQFGNRIEQKLDWDGGDWGWQEKPTRDWMWANRDELIGCKAEIQYQTFSDYPDEGGVWALQFPSFRMLKLDR